MVVLIKSSPVFLCRSASGAFAACTAPDVNVLANCVKGCKSSSDPCDALKCEAYCYNVQGCSDLYSLVCTPAASIINCDVKCSSAFSVAPTVFVVALSALVALFVARK